MPLLPIQYACCGKRRGVRRVRRFLVLSLAVLTLSQCGPGPEREQEEDRPAEKISVAPRNCLFIILDATVATHMSLYGYERETTPFIDGLARRGTHLSAMFSQDTATPPSAWSYMTGMYPFWVKGHVQLHHMRVSDRTLAQAFQEAGFATGAFSENPFIREKVGFDRGFDTFFYFHHRGEAAGEKGYTRDAKPSMRLAHEAKTWIRSAGNQRWFCYVHFLRPHNPYTPHEPFVDRFVEVPIPEGEEKVAYLLKKEENIFRKRPLNAKVNNFGRNIQPTPEDREFLKGMYDANLAFVDTLVQDLYTFLEAEGLAEDTLVIVASDHGEAFGEHDVYLHSSAPYQELIHVPFIVKAPESAGLRQGPIDAAVEMVDVMPTLVELFDLPRREILDGNSFLSLLRGETDDHAGLVIAQNVWTDTVSVRLGNRKLLIRLDEDLEEVLSYEVYDLEDDPAERHDLFQSESDIADLLGPALQYVRSRVAWESFSLSNMSPEEIADLRALGYLGEYEQDPDDN